MKKFLLLVFSGFLLLGLVRPTLADHIPQSLIDAVFYEMENAYCQRDPECDFLNFDDDDEYLFCMKVILHDEYTRERLENILSFKNSYGYISADEEEEYDLWAEMVFWIGCY